MRKLLIGIGILIILAAIALYFFPRKPAEVTLEESYVLEDALNSLSEEELESISAELTQFNQQIEEQIASDLSIFFWE